ncbi:MAG: GyrI-like domain-containing protein [Promethearchaeota archaeon]
MSDNIKVKNIKSIRTAVFYSFSESPEEDAWEKAEKWLEKKDLLKKKSNIRVFGRNIYPTENPEPHGYGYYITVTPDIEIEKDINITIIPGGLYAITKCEGFEELVQEWPNIWKWVEESDYKYIGETKSDLGFELGLEEHINWREFLIDKSESNIIFNLMIQLYEE